MNPGKRRRSFLLVTQYFPPEIGAAQVRLAALVDALRAEGHRVDVLTALPNYPLGRIFDGWRRVPIQTEEGAGGRTTRLWVWASMGKGWQRMLNYLSFGAMSVLGLARARRTDWVVVEYPTLFGALPAVVWNRLRRRRVVVLVADLWVDLIAEFGALPEGRVLDVLRRLERWMLRTVDVVTAVSEGAVDVLVEKGADRDRMAWLPNGVDTTLFAPGDADPSVREELGASAGEHLVLYAGTHGYVHGLEVLLSAAELLRDEPVRVVLVGDGSEKPELVRQARERGLVNVSFHDPVPPERVAEMLRCATVAVATVRGGDRYHTIRSAKMMTIMSSGVPLVYSAADEGSRLVQSIGAGLVTPPGDPVALAGAIRDLVADPSRAEQLGNAGRRWVEEHVSWEHLVHDWVARLEELEVLSGARVAADRSADDAA